MNNPNRQTTNNPHQPGASTPQRFVNLRMGILIHHPPTHQISTNIRWSHVVIGMSFDHNPPNISFVTNIVNNHWDTREPIRVLRTGAYFIFECQNLLDREALITLNTTFIDGKTISFRPTSENQVPSTINFNMVRIWVRIQDLPWNYLTTDWAVRILSHVGLVEAIDGDNHGLPLQPYLRARLVFDITKPLIPGCFLPIEGNRVVWIYFRYEGFYKFCKECGCVGHNTGRCPLSAYEARRIIMRRIHDFEESGMIVLQTHGNLPLYTNLIRDLIDRFIHKNPRINLHQIRPQMAAPSQDPYLFPHLYMRDQVPTDSSSEDFYDTSPEFPPHNPLHPYQYYSDDNFQHHTNPPADFSNYSPQHYSHHWGSNSLGSRFGVSEATRASVTNTPEHTTPLDLNLSPRHTSPNPLTHETPHETPPVAASTHFPLTSTTNIPVNFGSSMLRNLNIPHWTQGSFRPLNNLCFPRSYGPPVLSSPSPPSPSNIRQGTGPLSTLVAQGWHMQPPDPDEAGPSNWVERNAAAAVEAQGLGAYHSGDNQMSDNIADSPPDLEHLSNFINDRFRLSPPIFADVFNPLLQEQIGAGFAQQTPNAGIYSPTSPLNMVFSSSGSDDSNINQGTATSNNRQLMLGLKCHSSSFSGKRRRDGLLQRSCSVDSFFVFTGSEEEIRRKKRKKRYEEWDAKGGFILRRAPLSEDIHAKALTDISMACEMGVEASVFPNSVDRKKRVATASPLDLKGDWSLKRSKTSDTDLQSAATAQDMDYEHMELNFQLNVTSAEPAHSRDVVDPPQPPTAQ